MVYILRWTVSTSCNRFHACAARRPYDIRLTFMCGDCIYLLFNLLLICSSKQTLYSIAATDNVVANKSEFKQVFEIGSE